MFLCIQIEEEKSCSYDFVDIFGGLDDYSGPLYGRYCGFNVSILDVCLCSRFSKNGYMLMN